MKKKHTEKFVLKIISDFDYTLEEVREQVYKYTGLFPATTWKAVVYLQQCDVETIRNILRFNKVW